MRTVILFLAIFFFHMSVSYAQVDIAERINPHNYNNKDYCQACHDISNMPLLNHDSMTTCIKCHENNIKNHPVSRHPILVNIPHKIVVPEWMPLSKENKIVCYTCHDYHNTGKMTHMLRINYDILCVSCHLNK